MRSMLACLVVAVALNAGCGGGSDNGGEDNGDSDSSSAQSAGDRQYIDPFQDPDAVACLSKREVRQKINGIASRVQNLERKQRAIKAVRDRAC